jgi:cobalamin synthase
VLDAKGVAKWDVGIELFEMVAFLGCFLMLFVALMATNIAARKETFGKEKGQRKIVRALLLLLVTAQCLLAANGCFMRIIYRVITDVTAAVVLNNIA